MARLPRLKIPTELGQNFFRLGPYFFRGVHRVARAALKRRGYRLDLRRRGELKLGIWRKTLRKPASPNRRLLFLPGFGDSPLSWLPVFAPLAPILSRKYDEILFLDFPGFHGFLEGEKAFMSMDQMQDFVFDTVDSLKPQTLVGHSLGGWLAATYATLCSERARPSIGRNRYAGPEKLVVISPSGLIRDDDKEKWKADFEQALGGEYVTFMRKMFRSMPGWYRFAGEAFSTFFQKAEIRSFIASVEERHFLTRRLQAVTAKPYVIWGDHDEITPSHWFELWREELGTGRTEGVLLKKAGHMPHVENIPKLIAVLAQVFAANEGLPRSGLLERLTSRFWKAV